MLIESPVRPEELASDDLNMIIPNIIARVNGAIKKELRLQESGPFACFSSKDIIPLSVYKVVLPEIIKLYESVGWKVYQDTEILEGNCKTGHYYLTFTSNIWKEKNKAK